MTGLIVLLELLSQIRFSSGCDSVRVTEVESRIIIRLTWFGRILGSDGVFVIDGTGATDWHFEINFTRVQLETTQYDVVSAMLEAVQEAKRKAGRA